MHLLAHPGEGQHGQRMQPQQCAMCVLLDTNQNAQHGPAACSRSRLTAGGRDLRRQHGGRGRTCGLRGQRPPTKTLPGALLGRSAAAKVEPRCSRQVVRGFAVANACVGEGHGCNTASAANARLSDCLGWMRLVLRQLLACEQQGSLRH